MTDGPAGKLAGRFFVNRKGAEAMTFTLKIECDNAAFEGSRAGTELGRILHKLGHKLHSYCAAELDGGSLMDENGNKVGFFRRS